MWIGGREGQRSQLHLCSPHELGDREEGVIAAMLAAIIVLTSPGEYFLGFDRNVYPGDDKLPVLRQHFAFTGYWLGNPPGEKSNTWAGKRQKLQEAGFGFLLLFNSRSSTVLERGKPEMLGKSDGSAASQSAQREG